MRKEFIIASEQAMRELGGDVLKLLRIGDLVLLSGELGAGKTTLVRGALESLGYKEPVRSPTFNLIQLYSTTPPILHADLYRVDSLKGLDFFDLMDGHVSFVEWPERVHALCDFPGAFQVHIEVSASGRQVTLAQNISE